MANRKAIPDPTPCVVKLNGRVTKIEREESDRNDSVVRRVILRQSDPGCPTRPFVPFIDEELAKTILAGIKERDLVEIEAHVEASDERNASIVIDTIKKVSEIDEYLYSFELIAVYENLKRRKLPPRRGGSSSRLYELEVGGLHLKVFSSAAQAEVSDIEKGSLVKVEGYVKSFVNGEELRSNLYVVNIEALS